MRRINREEIDWLTMSITQSARQLGLIPKDATVTYGRGSTTNGQPPTVTVRAETGGHIPVSFLPTFTYKHTAKDVHLALTATRLALEAITARQ